MGHILFGDRNCPMASRISLTAMSASFTVSVGKRKAMVAIRSARVIALILPSELVLILEVTSRSGRSISGSDSYGELSIWVIS